MSNKLEKIIRCFFITILTLALSFLVYKSGSKYITKTPERIFTNDYLMKYTSMIFLREIEVTSGYIYYRPVNEVSENKTINGEIPNQIFLNSFINIVVPGDLLKKKDNSFTLDLYDIFEPTVIPKIYFKKHILLAFEYSGAKQAHDLEVFAINKHTKETFQLSNNIVETIVADRLIPRRQMKRIEKTKEISFNRVVMDEEINIRDKKQAMGYAEFYLDIYYFGSGHEIITTSTKIKQVLDGYDTDKISKIMNSNNLRNPSIVKLENGNYKVELFVLGFTHRGFLELAIWNISIKENGIVTTSKNIL